MRRDEALILDRVAACRRIIRFVSGSDEARFGADEKTYEATLHGLMVLGEAARRVSEGLKATHPEIPWRKIAGMRNVLVHEYDDVQASEVWETVRRDIPALLASLEGLVPREEP